MGGTISYGIIRYPQLLLRLVPEIGEPEIIPEYVTMVSLAE